MWEQECAQATTAMQELLDAARLRPGQLVVIGCSTSEVAGQRIGTESNTAIADALYAAWQPLLAARGLYLVAQCCEHLNRALILEQEAAERYGLEPVNVIPYPKAGGSFATAAYAGCSHPVTVEAVRAHAGLDVGQTLIGMHLRPVAVPVRVSVSHIGQALLTCARTRPKYIGGERAHYNAEE